MVTRTLQRLRSLVGFETDDHYGLLLSGGGARASYQAGVLRYIAETFPSVDFENMMGVSAGAINTAYLCNCPGIFAEGVHDLEKNWLAIREDRVFESESSFSFVRGLLFGTGENGRQAILNTEPLRQFLLDGLQQENGVITGIGDKLREGRLKAVAIVTTNYATGQTVTWVQGQIGIAHV